MFLCMPPCIEVVEQGEVGSWLFLSQAHIPPPWEDHQQAPLRRRTRAAPGGGRSTPDQALSPLPWCGGLLSGCGLLLGWSFAQITCVDGSFHLFFTHVCFMLHWKAPPWCIFHVFVSKLMEIVSSKALCLSLVSILVHFM